MSVDSVFFIWVGLMLLAAFWGFYQTGRKRGLREGYNEGCRVADAWEDAAKKWEAVAKRTIGE